MELWRCTICGGQGEITRPHKVVYSTTIYHWTDGYGILREHEIAVKTLVGGTDACPSCTTRAEMEWQIGKD